MRRAPSGHLATDGNVHDNVGEAAILANIVGILGLVLLFTDIISIFPDVDPHIGGLLVLAYLFESFFASKSFKALCSVMSEQELVHYIQKLQEAEPQVEFRIQNYHNQKRERIVRDKDGRERKEEFTERVNTHSASMTYPIIGHTDETLSPQQMVAMFHLMYDSKASGKIAQKKDEGRALLLICKFVVDFKPRDEATEADFPMKRDDFYKKNTTDKQQEKWEHHTLCGCTLKEYSMIVLHTAGTDKHTKPWWMSITVYVLSTFMFLSVVFRKVMNANTHKTTWFVTKHFSALDASTFTKDPIHTLKASKDKTLSAVMTMTPPGGGDGEWRYVPAKYPDVKLETDLPPYWTNKSPGEVFDAKEPVSEEFAAQIQRLLDRTFREKATRDRLERIPKRLRLVSAHRIEDQSMWSRYFLQKARIKALRNSCQAVCDMEGSGEVKTMAVLSDEYRKQLSKDVNEFYLFHGTSPTGAFGIQESGFQLNLAGSATGTMFGPGAYFAECCSKSDEYAKCDVSGVFAGVYAFLLCRVVCGEMFRITRSDIPAVQTALRTHKFDAVLGDREAVVGTYREFVVFSEAQIYPEYVVLYKRDFD